MPRAWAPAAPPGQKGPYSKSMTCQWRTELQVETSQWIVLIQKWKFCYLRNVTGRNQFVATTKTRVQIVTGAARQGFR